MKPDDPQVPPHGSPSQPSPSQNAARKSQKADREKLRRDRLNEHFLELGKALDPDRPKNDKGTILADTIQLLKDLTAEVNKLRTEYAVLTEESLELTQEKNDLKEEKASLKSDIDSLNLQYQHRSRATFQWGPVDPSVVFGPAGPPSYPFPVPVAMPSGPIPMHPYTFFTSPNPNMVPNSCSTFIPYITPSTQVEPLPAQFVNPSKERGNTSRVSCNVGNKNKSSSRKSDDSNEITTDLELKTPGSTADHDSSSVQRKSKKHSTRENSSEKRSSSRCSSSRSVQDSSSNSIVGGSKDED